MYFHLPSKFCRFCVFYTHEEVLRFLTVLKKESLVVHGNCNCTCQFCAEGFCQCVFHDDLDFIGTCGTCSAHLHILHPPQKENDLNLGMFLFVHMCTVLLHILNVLILSGVWKAIARLRTSVFSSGLEQYFIALGPREIFLHRRIL